VLVTGMFIGTIFTLFVVPAIYSLLAGDHSKHKNGLDKSEGSVEEQELYDLEEEERAFAN